MSLEELKTQAGDIPKPSCLAIDSIRNEIERYEAKVKRLAQQYGFKAPEYSIHPSFRLEELRKDNERLRELGKFWYRMYKKICPLGRRSTPDWI